MWLTWALRHENSTYKKSSNKKKKAIEKESLKVHKSVLKKRVILNLNVFSDYKIKTYHYRKLKKVLIITIVHNHITHIYPLTSIYPWKPYFIFTLKHRNDKYQYDIDFFPLLRCKWNTDEIYKYLCRIFMSYYNLSMKGRVSISAFPI